MLVLLRSYTSAFILLLLLVQHQVSMVASSFTAVVQRTPGQRREEQKRLPGFASHSQGAIAAFNALARRQTTGNDQAYTLQAGETRRREIIFKETHRCQIPLNTNHYARLLVTTERANLHIQIYAPDGTTMLELQRYYFSPKEPVVMVATTSGMYRVVIQRTSAEPALADYAIALEEIRLATEADQARVAADAAMETAEMLIEAMQAEATAKAKQQYQKALQLYQTLHDQRKQAGAWIGIGRASQTQGDNQQALLAYQQALTLAQTAGDLWWQCDAYNRLTFMYGVLDEFEKALEYAVKGLELARTLNNFRQMVSLLNFIGALYIAIGEPQKAHGYLSESLQQFQFFSDTAMQAYTLDLIGQAHQATSDLTQAVDFYQRALALMESRHDSYGQALMLSHLGNVYGMTGDYAKALASHQQALPLMRKSESVEETFLIQMRMASAYEALGKKIEAAESFAQLAPQFRAIGIRSSEAFALYRLARLERDGGNFAQACAHIEAAVQLAEANRGKLSNPNWRAAYSATLQDYYRLYVDLLMQQNAQHPGAGFDQQAFEILERSRARTLLELLKEAGLNQRQGVTAQLQERQATLLKQIRSKTDLQIRSTAATAQQKTTIERELRDLETAYAQTLGQIRAQHPQYAALMEPQAVTLTEMQKQFDAQTLLLEYALGDERSFVWMVTQNSLAVTELPAKSKIEEIAGRLYDALTARQQRKKESYSEEYSRLAKADREVEAAARQLSQMILAPIKDKLGDKRLLIVAEGALHYIPFAALPEPTGKSDATVNSAERWLPLLYRHEIINLPSASLLTLLRQPLTRHQTPCKAIAVLADPVFDAKDERVKNVGKTLPPRTPLLATQRQKALREMAAEGVLTRLPATRIEAEKIVQLAPMKSSLLALGFAANLQQATSKALADYRYIHFATHGLLNAQRPELSGVALSMVNRQGAAQEGFLGLTDIYNLQLPAELIVLSACQTALGREMKGEGLIGLTRGFIYAGAKRVIASLWKVDDAVTADLMRRFYEKVMRRNQRPAAALRAAQMEMMRQHPEPFYWAAFSLQGEWR